MSFSKELFELLGKEFEEFHIFKKNGEIRTAICIGSTILSKSFLFKGQLLSKTSIGGIRIKKYPDLEKMLEDAWRLAYEGMTFKSAFVEELKVGGAKMVFKKNMFEDQKENYKLIAESIDRLNGLYLGAEDMGMNEENLEHLDTPYILGRRCEEISGDPSPFTARSVLVSLETLLKFLNLASDPKDFSHLVFSVQGFGAVGKYAVAELIKRGAKKIFLSDKDQDKITKAKDLYGNKIQVVSVYDPEVPAVTWDMEISQKADVFIPCAIGGILNEKTMPILQFRAICGSANNQFSDEFNAIDLHQRGIICPGDFPVNNGGLVYTYSLLENRGMEYNPEAAKEIIDKNSSRIWDLLERSKKEKRPPQLIAVEMAKKRLDEAKIAAKKDIKYFKDEQIIKIHHL
jgi:leucine dehydrogenase